MADIDLPTGVLKSSPEVVTTLQPSTTGDKNRPLSPEQVSVLVTELDLAAGYLIGVKNGRLIDVHRASGDQVIA